MHTKKKPTAKTAKGENDNILIIIIMIVMSIMVIIMLCAIVTDDDLNMDGCNVYARV